MMIHELNWVYQHSEKLCPILRENIIKTYQYGKWVPGFLRKPLAALKKRLIKHKVIIQLAPEPFSPLAVTGSMERTLGCKIKSRLDLINGVSASVSIHTLQKIVAQEEVKRIWQDKEVHALLDVATPVVGAPPVWEKSGEGNGIGIAIVDTGIHPHPDLTTPENRIIAFKDLVNRRIDPYDDNGHGTHCAGDAAGNGAQSGGRYRGPAPKARLIGVKVLNKLGSGDTSTIIAGVQWCIDNKDRYGIRIISLSLGGKADRPADDDPLCLALRKAWEADLVVCAAAGNSGPEAGTINTPGIEPVIITVGAINDSNTPDLSDDLIPSFSSRGPTPDGIPKPDLVTPGVNIISLRAPGAYLDKKNRNSQVDAWYTSMSGTSMATPLCAGVIALLLEKFPDLTPGMVKSLLLETCRKMSADPNAEGAGLVNVQAAASRAGNNSQQPQLLPG